MGKTVSGCFEFLFIYLFVSFFFFLDIYILCPLLCSNHEWGVSLKGNLELKFIPNNTSLYKFALYSNAHYALFLRQLFSGLI